LRRSVVAQFVRHDCDNDTALTASTLKWFMAERSWAIPGMVFEGPLQWCPLSAAARRSHMSAQNPVGVIPARKSVRRTIEVTVLRGTSENCTLDCMRRANPRHSKTGRPAAAVRLGFRRRARKILPRGWA